MDPRAGIVAVSELKLGPFVVSMAPDQQRFAFAGIPDSEENPRFGIYVAAFHEKKASKLIGLPFPRSQEPYDVSTAIMLDWSPDSRMILVSDSRVVSAVSLESGLMRKLADGGGAQWSPSSDWLSYVTLEYEAALLNVKTGEKRLIDKNHKTRRQMEWSPDGKYLLIAEGEGTHVPYGCLWVYRVSDGAFVPIPYYGMGKPLPHWIQLGH
jgi:hypothetical protein